MSNVYAAPQTEVRPVMELEASKHYIVSPKKFWILFMSTLGMYGVYWLYKHWLVYKTNTGEKLWPVARAIFSVFFTHKLFSAFSSSYKESTNEESQPLSKYATCYVLLAIADQICTKMSQKEVGSPMTDILSLIFVPLMGLTFVKAQVVANVAAGDELGESNDSLGVANWIWILIGALLWILSAIGISTYFFPEFFELS